MSVIRILNQEVHLARTLYSGLRGLHGIGNLTAHKICAMAGFHPDTRLKDMRHSMGYLQKIIESQVQPKPLQLRLVGENIIAKVKSQSYQGQRHQYCLPLNGQKRNNQKTQQRLGLLRSKIYSFPLAKPNKKNRK